MKHGESSQSSADASVTLNSDTTSQALNDPSTQTEHPKSTLQKPVQQLSRPAIAGVVFGCLAVLGLTGLALFLWSRKRRRKLPSSAAFAQDLNMGPPRKKTPIYEEFSSVYRSQSVGVGDNSPKRSMDGLDLLDGQPGLANVERNEYEPYLSMYKTGAVRSAYTATLRPEDSASTRVRSSPPSEVESQTQNDHVTYFTPTISMALPSLPE